MIRRALLFGNTNGLGGVKKDIINYTNFLKSETGGQWNDSEITILMDPKKEALLLSIELLKLEKPDFAIIIFSGHGAYSKGTLLEINKKEECISENDLRGISSRQISIFDCCRNVIQVDESVNFSGTTNIYKSNNLIRKKYDERIMQSIEQQISLYACSIGQSSYDTNDGGAYTTSLLSSVTPERSSLFKLVASAHEEATPKTTEKAWKLYSKIQVPDHTIPKCISSQQLIISINPSFFNTYFNIY